MTIKLSTLSIHVIALIFCSLRVTSAQMGREGGVFCVAFKQPPKSSCSRLPSFVQINQEIFLKYFYFPTNIILKRLVFFTLTSCIPDYILLKQKRSSNITLTSFSQMSYKGNYRKQAAEYASCCRFLFLVYFDTKLLNG